MTWVDQLERLVNQRLQVLVGNIKSRLVNSDQELLERKLDEVRNRNSEIVKATANGQILSQKNIEGTKIIDYVVHQQILIKQQNNKFYIEERLENRQAMVKNNKVFNDLQLPVDFTMNEEDPFVHSRQLNFDHVEDSRQRYHYDRRAAVQYAERWWNSYNPKYKKFTDDCTNFISQCLHEGGIPMTGFGNRSKGWWYTGKSWSYSWAVANAFRWYLSGAKQGIRTKEVPSARDLILGDIICYDFEGDGKWNHNTIVVAKDANNEPLVNAHTYNSRMRYWAYTDSSAYTPNIKYKFFHILDRS